MSLYVTELFWPEEQIGTNCLVLLGQGEFRSSLTRRFSPDVKALFCFFVVRACACARRRGGALLRSSGERGHSPRAARARFRHAGETRATSEHETVRWADQVFPRDASSHVLFSPVCGPRVEAAAARSRRWRY